MERNITALTNYSNKIVRLIKEKSSIVWIKTYDRESVFDIIDQLVSDDGYSFDEHRKYKLDKNKILTWNIAYGRRLYALSREDDNIIQKLDETIADFASDDNICNLLILDDISNLLYNHADSTKVISLLQDFSYNNTKWRKIDRLNNHRPTNKKTIIVISPNFKIVDNLNHLVEIIEEPVPDELDIQKELGFDILENNPELRNKIINNPQKKGYSYGRYKFSSSFMRDYATQSKKLISALLGMHMYDIRKLLYSLLSHSEPLNAGLNVFDSISRKQLSECVSDEKKRIVQNSGLLQVINIDFHKQKNRVGNINNLRCLLERQKFIIDNIEKYNQTMPKPKGILLVGAPGCGKSEAAKSVAAILEKPLLRLDIGALMGQYVGVSEHNLIEAIKIAEAAQPCVLWIDEIEKAFAGFGNSDSGNDITVMRMVGYFLTWMQERKSLVYLVATANNLDNLRPELLRKGRWDKILYLSYPDKSGIKDIFKRCLDKYQLSLDVTFDNKRFNDLVDEIYNQEMSGADIDSIIVEAYNDSFSQTPESENSIIRVDMCLSIVRNTNSLQYKKDTDEELVKQSMLNYKISAGRFDWDEDKSKKLELSLNEYRLSSGNMDYDTPIDKLVDEMINDIKISIGKVKLDNESELRQLIEQKIRSRKSQEKKVKDILLSRIEKSYKEKENIEKTFKEQIAHKGREEQEKYYRSKGYEPAS